MFRATFATSTRKINENSWRTKAKKLQSWRSISSFHFELKEILGNVGRYMAHVESFWGLLLRITMFSIFVCFLLLFYLVIRRARKKIHIYIYIHLNLRSIYMSQFIELTVKVSFIDNFSLLEVKWIGSIFRRILNCENRYKNSYLKSNFFPPS